MTKEELQKENAELTSHLEVRKDQDKAIRQEFARAFHWYEPNLGTFGSEEKKLISPSWAKIWIEIGKLLERQKRLNYVEDIEQYRLEQKSNRNEIEEIKRKLQTDLME